MLNHSRWECRTLECCYGIPQQVTSIRISNQILSLIIILKHQMRLPANTRSVLEHSDIIIVLRSSYYSRNFKDRIAWKIISDISRALISISCEIIFPEIIYLENRRKTEPLSKVIYNNLLTCGYAISISRSNRINIHTIWSIISDTLREKEYG